MNKVSSRRTMLSKYAGAEKRLCRDSTDDRQHDNGITVNIILSFIRSRDYGGKKPPVSSSETININVMNVSSSPRKPFLLLLLILLLYQ